MKVSKRLLVCVLVVLSSMTLAASSHAELRFGPWVYFAPYYFPPDGCCLGYCFGPDDFIPRYESPNPPIPSHDVGPCLGCPGPAPIPRKVTPRSQASRPTHSMAPAPRLREDRPVPSETRVLQPSRTDRTGVPASLNSTPAVSNQLPAGEKSLQQPQAVNHPGPQPSESASRTITRPLKWGQDRSR
jgi:hypothetical protein